MMLITKEFRFDSAHQLPFHKGKCAEMHGHGYVLHITLHGPVNDEGMVIDFAHFKRVVEEKVISYLDHKSLNQVMKNPTAENTTIWIFRQLCNVGFKDGIRIFKIKLWETPTSFVEYYPGQLS